MTEAPEGDQPFTPSRLLVFGGMRLYVDNAEVDIGPPRQRAILALLVAARGEPVSQNQLTDALWGTDAPASAANQIHRLVGNLRRVLEPSLAARENGRYLLAAGSTDSSGSSSRSGRPRWRRNDSTAPSKRLPSRRRQRSPGCRPR
jgi:Transcriptional regulatory protein, C terminal